MSTLHLHKRSGQRRIEVLVGPIASGKSTYVANRVRGGWVVVNDDAIYAAIHGGDYGKYDRNLKALYKSTENHVLTMAVALNRDVIVDRPNVTKMGRARYIALATSFDVKEIVAVVFPVQSAEVHATRRFHADARGQDYQFWLDAAEHQVARYEEPDESEGFTEVHYIP